MSNFHKRGMTLNVDEIFVEADARGIKMSHCVTQYGFLFYFFKVFGRLKSEGRMTVTLFRKDQY